MTLLENINLYLTDFYYFCFTDYYSAKGSFLLLLFFICILHYILKLEIFCSKKNINTFRNTCLQSNLLDYHRIMYSFFQIYNVEQTFTKDQLIKMTEKRKVNIYNLYYIMNLKTKKELLNIINKHKKYIAYNIIKNKKCFIKGPYIKEMQHCNLIIEILEKKQDGEKIDFGNFVKKMLTSFDD